MSSGSVILGSKTNFDSILSPGDFIFVKINDSKPDEKRKITMVLSSESVGIDTPFSKNIREQTKFKYQTVKKVVNKAEEELKKKK